MKTRTTGIFLLVFLSHFCVAQKVDLCRYFSVTVSEMISKGELKKFVSTNIDTTINDQLSAELKSHQSRYNYLLNRIFKNNESLKSIYPDSIQIKNIFCQQLNGNTPFRNNFDIICSSNFSNKKSIQFSLSEMMFVASRFFYCNKVNKDTSIIPKICIGINGIKEMNASRDLAALEAFVFEAIFNSLQGENEPKFLNDFTQGIEKSMKQRKDSMKSLDDFLIQVRNDCFRDMEQNEDIKKSLLAYYNKNKSNINFTIQ